LAKACQYVLDLARHLDSALEDLNFDKLVIEGFEEVLTAEEFADALRARLDYHFGKASPKVVLAPNLSSKAAANSKRIRIRSSASFTPRDVEQLLHHEALIHAATGKNGQGQKHFKLLGRAHAGTTEIQEGLAVGVISGGAPFTKDMVYLNGLLRVHNFMRTVKFMPPWVKDLRFLVSYMAYSGFLNQVKLPGFQSYYTKELDDVPVVWNFGHKKV